MLALNTALSVLILIGVFVNFCYSYVQYKERMAQRKSLGQVVDRMMSPVTPPPPPKVELKIVEEEPNE